MWNGAIIIRAGLALGALAGVLGVAGAARAPGTEGPAGAGAGAAPVTRVAKLPDAQGGRAVAGTDGGMVTVTPAAAAVSAPEGTVQTVSFAISWDGPEAAALDLNVWCGGDLGGCVLARPRVTLGGVNPAQAEVVVSYRTGAAGTPPDEIVVRAVNAANGSEAGEGLVTVTATRAMGLDVSGANPGLEALRGDCLALASGAGVIECDDYRIDYPLLPVTRMNVPRTLRLLYNSALASPKPVVGANVTLAAGTTGDSIAAELRIGGNVVGRVSHAVSGWVAGVANRIGFALDRYLDRGNKVVDYDVTLRRFRGGAQAGSAVRASGEYISVDRRGEFGRGWWPAGYERIDALADGRLLWTGGDGSARVYKADPNAAGTWVAETRGRPDTIVRERRGGGRRPVFGYVRKLIGGGKVRYDSSGLHEATVDRNGNETRFVHGTVAGARRLTAIRLPRPGGWDEAYRFGYDSSGRLSTVSVLGGDGTMKVYRISATSTTVGSGSSDGYTINSITAPDGRITRFSYSATGDGVLERVTDPRGVRTEISYTASKVSQVRVVTPHDASIPTITMAYQAARTTGSGHTGAPASRPADSVSARFDGPRTDVSDTTRFFVTGWGAVRGIRDALGNETTLVRGNTTFPAFVTRAFYPSGLRLFAWYDATGLLSSVWNSAVGASSTYQWDTKWSRISRITSIEGVVTAYTYDPANGNRLSITADGAVTRYGYNTAGQVTKISGARGDTTRLAYDAAQGNLASVTTPLGRTTTYAYDRAGMRILTRSPAHQGTSGAVFRLDSVHYDVMGRDTLAVSRSTDTAETGWLRVRTAYAAATGDRLSVIPYADHPVGDSMTTGANRWTYDGLGRVVTEQGAGRDSVVYDVAGNVAKRFKLTPGGTAVPVYDTLKYDAMNRLVERVTAARSYAADNTALVAPFPYYSRSGLTIPADTATFAYDAAGNLVRAVNGYASVARMYSSDGVVSRDTLRIRNYRDPGTTAGPGYGQTYALNYSYTRDRRRTMVAHPSVLGGGNTRYTYAATSGLLSTVTGPGNEVYTFTYDANGQPSGRTFAGGSETLTRDLDGLVTRRTITGAGVRHLSETLAYDHRGKVVRETGSSAEMAYTGLGHLRRMSHNSGIPPRLTVETFQPNGLGLVVRDSTSLATNSRHGDVTVHASSYGPGGRLTGKTQQWVSLAGHATPANWKGLTFSRRFDPATGDLLAENREREAWGATGPGGLPPFTHTSDRIHESRSYYSADGKLRVHQTNRARREGLRTTPHLDTLDGVYEVYWYDALGRRVLKRSIQKNGELCDTSHARCHDTIERYVWDGDRLHGEVRGPGASNAAAGGTAGRQAGKIIHVHAGGVDAPLGMVRNRVPYALHANWRGLYSFATGSTGAKAEARTVEWPANNRRAFLGAEANNQEWTWFGSLVSSGTDASGLLYRRNRYYDPLSGQFTQQDPIGIAGGLNLYGFADGDPVNYSDPFGLCVPWCLISAGKEILTDYGLAKASGEDYGLGQAALSGVLGATGIGYIKKGFTWVRKAWKARQARKVDSNTNKLHHVFKKKGRNFDAFLSGFRSEEAALKAIQKAARRHIKANQITGEYRIVVPINGFDITVKGKVMDDGIVRFGTVFPKRPGAN